MEHLRRLDRSVTKPGTVISLIVGIFRVIAAYPLYTHITKKQREKLPPEIMRLFL